MTVEEILETKGSHIYSVDHTSTIQHAIKVMTDNKVGAIFVEKNGKIVGIWTERDLLRNMMEKNFSAATCLIGDYMMSPVISIAHNMDVYQLMDRFLGLRLRHLPVKKRGKYIGMLSVGDCLKTVLNLRTKELAKVNKIASWSYYEEWGWSANKKKEYGPAIQVS